jgi:molecular chaperone GrpE
MTSDAPNESALSAVHDRRDTPENARSEDISGPPSCPAEGSEGVAAGVMSLIDPSELARIWERLDELRALFDTRMTEAEQHQQWVAQLVSQLGEYRNDFVFKNITGRIFRDLIQLYDTFGQTLDAAARREINEENMIARLRNMQRQVMKILDRQGVEHFTSITHTRFDESEQEAIGVQPVDRPEDDGIVLEFARCGFRYGTRLLRPESVIVGRYEPKGGEAGD